MNKKIMTVVAIIGPTAVGKTKYAIDIALNLNGEIISADSMQVYRHMNIGSAKPTRNELETVSHHLIDEVDPFEAWTVADYQKKAIQCIEDINLKGKLPIVSGGTGLYVNSLIYKMDFATVKENKPLRQKLQHIADTEGGEALHRRLALVDPKGAWRIHPNNIKRLIRAIEVVETTGKTLASFDRSLVKNEDLKWIIVGLNRNREELYNRINQRVDEMIKAGLLDEVRALTDKGLTENHYSMKGIGYEELMTHLNGNYGLEEAINLIKQRSRNYAKRQMTWFRRYDNIKWFDITDDEVNYSKNIEEILNYIRFNLYNCTGECDG